MFTALETGSYSDYPYHTVGLPPSWVSYRELLGWWSPSTNPAHAGEARRKAGVSGVRHDILGGYCCVAIHTYYSAVCFYADTNGHKGKAEALATCRAIVVALQAADAAEKGGRECLS